MKRVLTIFPDNLSKPTGGLGVQMNYFLKHIKDVEFDIIGQPDENEENMENYTGVYNALPNIMHSSLITATGQIQYFAEAIKRPKPDIVHAYDWSTYFAGYYVAQHFGVPLVTTMQLSINLLNQAGIHYTNDINSPDGFWINRVHCEMELFALDKADKVIQVSNAYAKRFQGIQDKTEIVPNGIEMSEWQPKNKVELEGKKSVIYIGRFASMKNIQALVNTKLPDDVHLYFVGNQSGGEQVFFEAIQKVSEEKPNFHYYGEAFGQEKVDLLFSADAVIVPSLHEPFGIVGLEGLASKSIVLSSRIDGLSDFLNDDNSIHCGITPESIENAMYKLLFLDEAKQQSMIENGLKTCAKYSWEESARKMERIYHSI